MAAVMVDVNKFLGTFSDVLNMMKDIGLISRGVFSYSPAQVLTEMIIEERHLQLYMKFLENAKGVLDQLSSLSNPKENFENLVLGFGGRNDVNSRLNVPCNEETKAQGPYASSGRYNQLKATSGHETQFTAGAQPRYVNLNEPPTCDLSDRFSPLDESQFNTSDSLSRCAHYNMTEVNYNLGGSSVSHDNSLTQQGSQYDLANQLVINNHFIQAPESRCENSFNGNATNHMMQFHSCSREGPLKHFNSGNEPNSQDSQYVTNKNHHFSSKPSCEFVQQNETQDSHFASPTNDSNCDSIFTPRCETAADDHFNCDTTFDASNHSGHGILPPVQFQRAEGSHNPHYSRSVLPNNSNYIPQSKGQHQSTFSLESELVASQYQTCQEPSNKQFSTSSNQRKLLYSSSNDICEARFTQLNNSSSYVMTQNDNATESRYVSNVASFKWGELSNTEGHSYDPSPPANTRSSEFGDLDMVLSRELERNGVESSQKRTEVEKEISAANLQENFTAFRSSTNLENKETKRMPVLDGAKVDGGKWRCPVCSRSFIIRTNLERHYRTHLGQKAFPCSHCEKGFSSKVRLDAHLVRQHNLNQESATPCPVCKKLFTTKSALETHRLTHVDESEKPFACTTCNKRFSQKVVLEAHMLRHAGPGAYKFHCELCPKSFPTQAKLKFHWRSHGNSQHQCSQCPKRFATQVLLRVHEQTHTDLSQRPFRCSECPKTFTTNYKLQQHMETHGEANQYTCPHCSSEFRCRATLVSHIRSRHSESTQLYPCPVPDCRDGTPGFTNPRQLDQHLTTHGLAESPKHKCPLCPKMFTRKSNLQAHEQSCHVEGAEDDDLRPHVCNICSKRFKQKSKLRIHLSTHTQEPSCSCSTCGKRFYRPDQLRIHEAIHSGNKPFTCEVCARRFVTRSMLHAHEKIHKPRSSDGSEVPCPKCGKKFKNKRTLALHEKSHADSLEFTCGTCGKQFARRVHYDGHLRTHSAARPYSCTVCGRTFRERKHRVDHMRRLHPNEVIGGGELTLQGLIDSITAEDGLDTSATGASYEADASADPLASLTQLSNAGMDHLLSSTPQQNSSTLKEDSNHSSQVNHMNQSFATQSQPFSLDVQINSGTHMSQNFNDPSRTISQTTNLSQTFASQIDNSSSNHMNESFSCQSQNLALMQSSFNTLKNSEARSHLASDLEASFACSESEALSSLPELSDLVASTSSHGLRS